MTERIFVNSEFPPALELAARLEAARRRISRSELVRQAVSKFLEESLQPATTGNGKLGEVKNGYGS